MGAFIARQPNGRLCRFSTVVDTVTHYNMTNEDFVEFCAEQAREAARRQLEYGVKLLIWFWNIFAQGKILKKTSTTFFQS